MKKYLVTFAVCMIASVSTFALYTTNYYNQYGASTGIATTRSNYGGGYTTNYYDQYGRSEGSSTTRTNYGGGSTTSNYYEYGRSFRFSNRR